MLLSGRLLLYPNSRVNGRSVKMRKSMFLDSILDYERTTAVALFKQVELPKILSAEKEKTDIIHRSLKE